MGTALATARISDDRDTAAQAQCGRDETSAIKSQDDATFERCDRCGESVEDDQGHEVDDETWCQSCYDNHAFDCERCGDTGQTADAVFIGDDPWCEDCWRYHGGTCNGCDERFDEDDLDTDYDDDSYCESCRDNGEGRWSDDDDEYDGETILEHDTDLLDLFPGIVLNAAKLYIGFELELNANDQEDRYTAARAFLNAMPDMGIVKHDGSIGDGTHGIEIVSIPQELPEARNLIVAILSNSAITSNAFADGSCGMHVHGSRSVLSDAGMIRLARFIFNGDNAEFLEALAARTLRGSRWANIGSEHAALANLYSRERKDRGGLAVMTTDRYLALNLTNAATVEFRFFASTTNAERACANLEASAALIAFCRAGSRSFAAAASATAFCEFVHAEAAQYPHLAAVLSTIAAHASRAVA